MDSRQVFEILVRENADMLRAFLLSTTRDPVLAEDLFQDAFMTAWKNLHRYDHQLPFGPWLRGIAAKLLLAHGRKLQRAKVYYCDAESLQLLESQYRRLDTFTGDTWDERLQALRQCVEQLGPTRRSVIELHYERGLNCKQIAERIDKGFEAVKKHLQRARSDLLQCLQGRLEPVAEELR
jgi:RNA polymerase sigma-70 factor (ECF subfamily)